MKICIVTPAKKYSKSGNRVSARRWAFLLKKNFHEVSLLTDYNQQPCDLMIALHAWRSAKAIKQYRTEHPKKPLIVVLGGTDVNTFLHLEPEITLWSMEAATKLVALNSLTKELLPLNLQKKVEVILQSATPLENPREPKKNYFDTCFIAHLRDEKDPLRPALAARLVNKSSKLRVIHMGKALSVKWAKCAHSEMISNPRYHWLGEVSSQRTRQEYQRTRLMIVSSVQEGGSNVMSEAIVSGIPIIASRISGNIGLLGSQYPAYFSPKNEKELASLLMRAEQNPNFLNILGDHIKKLRPKFLPKTEANTWERVISEITHTGL